jgi:hypothetical protein
MVIFIERLHRIAFLIKTQKCRRWHRVYGRAEDFSKIFNFSFTVSNLNLQLI